MQCTKLCKKNTFERTISTAVWKNDVKSPVSYLMTILWAWVWFQNLHDIYLSPSCLTHWYPHQTLVHDNFLTSWFRALGPSALVREITRSKSYRTRVWGDISGLSTWAQVDIPKNSSANTCHKFLHFFYILLVIGFYFYRPKVCLQWLFDLSASE